MGGGYCRFFQSGVLSAAPQLDSHFWRIFANTPEPHLTPLTGLPCEKYDIADQNEYDNEVNGSV